SSFGGVDRFCPTFLAVGSFAVTAGVVFACVVALSGTLGGGAWGEPRPSIPPRARMAPSSPPLRGATRPCAGAGVSVFVVPSLAPCPPPGKRGVCLFNAGDAVRGDQSAANSLEPSGRMVMGRGALLISSLRATWEAAYTTM